MQDSNGVAGTINNNDIHSPYQNSIVASAQQQEQQQTSVTTISVPPSPETSPLHQYISIDTAIERVGYGPFQVRIMIATGLCFAADAMEVLLLSFLAVVLQVEWNLSSEQTALLTSIVFIGALFGTLCLGRLGDKWGRRPIFILAASMISFFGIVTAFCNTFWTLCLMRMMVGFGVGGLTIPFDILSEVLGQSARGKNLLYIEYFWTAGTLLVPLFAYVTIGNHGTAKMSNSKNGTMIGGWRCFVVLCALPCIVSAVLGRLWVPESPRWLTSMGQEVRALEILRHAATMNGLDANIIFPDGTMLRHEPPETASICDLVRPAWRRMTLLLWIVWFGFAFMYYGTILSITLVFATENDLGDDADAEASFDFDYQALFVSCSAEFFGTTFAILLIDRIGRIPLQSMSFLGGGLSVMFMLLFANRVHRVVLIVLAFSARWFMMSGTCTAWVGTAEILSTDIRSTGHSVANAVARVGGFLAPFMVQEGTKLNTIALTMIIVSVASCLAVTGLPETKDKAMGIIHRDCYDEDDEVFSSYDADDEGSAVEMGRSSSGTDIIFS